MVMAENTILEDIDTGIVERQYRYFNAKVLENHQTAGTNLTLKKAIEDEKMIVFKNNSTLYVNIADYV